VEVALKRVLFYLTPQSLQDATASGLYRFHHCSISVTAGNRGTGLLYNIKCMILTATVFD